MSVTLAVVVTAAAIEYDHLELAVVFAVLTAVEVALMVRAAGAAVATFRRVCTADEVA